MADRIRFSINVTPIETLTDENSGTRDIIASEVNRSLGGSGDSVTLSDYSGLADVQGYKDAAVNYRSAGHGNGGTALSVIDDPDFIFIKNTGYKYSDATSLGASTTDCVIVALAISAQDAGNTGGWVTAASAPAVYYAGIAYLKPGQAILLPSAYSSSLTTFGASATDYAGLNSGSAGDGATIRLVVKTVQANSTAATTPNAVEFLAVT